MGRYDKRLDAIVRSRTDTTVLLTVDEIDAAIERISTELNIPRLGEANKRALECHDCNEYTKQLIRWLRDDLAEYQYDKPLEPTCWTQHN